MSLWTMFAPLAFVIGASVTVIVLLGRAEGRRR